MTINGTPGGNTAVFTAQAQNFILGGMPGQGKSGAVRWQMVQATPEIAEADAETGDRIARLRARHPELTAPEAADRPGISARTVRRHPAGRQDTPDPA